MTNATASVMLIGRMVSMFFDFERVCCVGRLRRLSVAAIRKESIIYLMPHRIILSKLVEAILAQGKYTRSGSWYTGMAAVLAEPKAHGFRHFGQSKI
jgi:hypothetical protein